MPDLICRFHDQTARSGTSENALRTEDNSTLRLTHWKHAT